jgi:hypothetical protein
MRAMRCAGLILGAMCCAWCGRLNQSGTAPTEVTITTQVFQGVLPVGGSRFYSFTVTQGGTASFMLASISSPGSGVAVQTVLGLGTGVPAGTGCAVSESITTSASLRSQFTRSLTPGIYCVNVWDVGNLASTVNFAVRFEHP